MHDDHHFAPSAGSIFLVVAPSGRRQVDSGQRPAVARSRISTVGFATTRAPRPGEVQGREYHFTDETDFLARRERGEFLESAEVHGNYYGTSRHWIDSRLLEGDDVLLEIDWQGARQVKTHFPQAVGVFILPPSIDALEARLHKRGQDSPQVIARRLLAAGAEMAHAPEFDFVLINEDFERALNQLSAIVTAARLRYPNQAARQRELFAQFGLP